MKSIVRGMAAAVLGGLFATSAAWAAGAAHDPWAGHWQLDAAKSTLNGQPAYKSGDAVLKAIKGGIESNVTLTPADGAPIHYQYSGRTDGSDIAVSGSPMMDSLTLVRLDKHTAIRTDRRGGKVVGVTTLTLAKDGKSFTATGRGTSVDGHPYTTMTTWHRVK